MARKRMIDPEFYSDEKLAEVSLEAGYLFIGTWLHADDHGNLRHSATKLKAQVFPLREEITSKVVDTLLEELLGIQVLLSYSENGSDYLHIKNFHRYQKIDRPSKAVHPLYSPSSQEGLDEQSMRARSEGNRKELNGTERGERNMREGSSKSDPPLPDSNPENGPFETPSPDKLKTDEERILVHELAEHRGYPSPDFDRELTAMRWMHDQKYANVDVMACLKAMEKDKWWSEHNKAIMLWHVKEQIGNFKAKGKDLSPSERTRRELERG